VTQTFEQLQRLIIDFYVGSSIGVIYGIYEGHRTPTFQDTGEELAVIWKFTSVAKSITFFPPELVPHFLDQSYVRGKFLCIFRTISKYRSLKGKSMVHCVC